MKKEKAIETADKYVADGKYDKALKAYQKVIAANPDDMRLKVKLGDLFVKRKEIAKALETYNEVAQRYVQDRFHLKAIALFKMMLKLNPTMVTLNEKLGDLYREVGLQKDAISQYFIVADHYEQSGHSKELLEVRRKIVETDPSAITSRIRLAEIYQKEGSTDDSLREYERAAEDLKARNDRDALIEVYERIFYHKATDESLINALCRLYMEKDSVDKAQERLESLSSEMKAVPGIKELAIDVYLKLEQREKVRRIIRDLYETYVKAGDAQRAAKLYQRAYNEFVDDEEYLEELSALRDEAGLPNVPVTPEAPPAAKGLHDKISDEDLEKTTMVRLDELPTPETPPAAKGLHDKISDEDLEKTTMVRVDDLPPPEEKPSPSPQAKKEGIDLDKTQKTISSKSTPAVNLDETVMVTAEELEKQFKGKKKKKG